MHLSGLFKESDILDVHNLTSVTQNVLEGARNILLHTFWNTQHKELVSKLFSVSFLEENEGAF